MYEEYSAETMSFNPPVQAPPNKMKKGKMTQVSTAPFDKLQEFSVDVDYFKSVNN